MWESCAREWQKIWQRVAYRAGVACKEVFSWCCVSLLLTVQKDKVVSILYFTGDILAATDRLELLCRKPKIRSCGMT